MLAAAAFYAALAIYTWWRRSVPGAFQFVFMVVADVPYAIGAAFLMAAADTPTKIFWTKFQILWMMPAVTAELCFLLEYANLNRWLTRRNITLLAVPPLLLALLAVTNNFHHAVWAGFSAGEYVHPVRGWAGWLFSAYGFALATISSGFTIWLFMRSPMHRLPAAVCFCGQLATRITFLLEAVHKNPFAPMDSTAIAMAFTLAMYALALFRFGMFDLLVVARGTMIEQMREGVLVLDRQQHIVDMNPAAANILGLPAESARGGVVQILPESTGLTRLAVPAIGPSKISIGVGTDTRHYEVYTSSLNHRRGFQLGYLILLHDTTEKERVQEQLMEQQRALATLKERDRVGRELHDSLGQVLGYVKMQVQAVRALLAQEQSAQADSYLKQLAAVAQDAHADVREYILGARTGTGSDSDFLPALERYLRRFRETYGIAMELKVSPDLTEASLTPMVRAQLLRIIQEALTNVRKHAQSSGVRITLCVNGGYVEAIVQDDGTGFDPALMQVKGGEKFGLHFMQERAAEVGGSVKILSAPGKGTQVIISVPLEGSWYESNAS